MRGILFPSTPLSTRSAAAPMMRLSRLGAARRIAETLPRPVLRKTSGSVRVAAVMKAAEARSATVPGVIPPILSGRVALDHALSVKVIPMTLSQQILTLLS